MAGGQQFTGTPGTLGDARLVQLRSRKVGGGTAVVELSGQQYAALQGAFGKTRTKALAGSALSHSLGAVTASGTQPPPLVPVADVVQLGELLADGPNFPLASIGLWMPWTNPNDGDWLDASSVAQGTTQFSRLTISVNQDDQPRVWAVSTLIQKLLTDGNTGIMVRATTGQPPAFASRQHGTFGFRPAFRIVTSTGTFDRGSLADASMATASTSQGELTNLLTPFVIKPDLTGVTGTVTSATMTLTTQPRTQGLPSNVDLFYLKMPPLIHEPARQLGGVVQGIANAGANDLALAAHPSVLFYPRTDSVVNMKADWNGESTNFSGGFCWNPTFVSWAAYGLTAIRFEATPAGGSSVMTMNQFLGPNVKEAYVRYGMLIDSDAYDGINENGVKLPGFGNGAGGGVSYRMEHFNQSPSNQHAYGYFVHAYDAERPPSLVGADNRRVGNVCLRAEHIYWIEQRVKMNTKTGSVWNNNGILQIWVDGVLCFSDTSLKIVDDTITVGPSNINGQTFDHITEFFANFFHGGAGSPTQTFHYEFGGVCVATQYIGPAKVVTGQLPGIPAWRPPEGYFADIPTNNDPQGVFTSFYPSEYWVNFADWGGGCVLRDYSPLGAFGLHAGGHETAWNSQHVQGALVFDFSTLLWACTNKPSQVNLPGHPSKPELYTNVDINGEFPDGSCYQPHSYLGLHEMPTAWGGGPKGSMVTFDTPSLCTVNKRPELSMERPTVIHKLDVSQGTGGYSRLNNNTMNGFPVAVRDDMRQGWWMNGGVTTHPQPPLLTIPEAQTALNDSRIHFLSKTGVVGPSYEPTGVRVEWGMVLWPARDLLILYTGGYFTGGNASTIFRNLYILDLANGGQQQTVLTTGKPPHQEALFSSAKEAEGMPTIVSGGSGYAVGNSLSFTMGEAGPGSELKFRVTSVSGGAITGVAYFDRPYVGFTALQRGWYGTPLGLTMPGALSNENGTVSGTANTMKLQAGSVAEIDASLVGGSIRIYRGPGAGPTNYTITGWVSGTATVTVTPNFLVIPTAWNPGAGTGNTYFIQKPPFSQVSTSGGGTGAAFTVAWGGAKDGFRPWFSGLHWVEPLGCCVGFDNIAGEIVKLTPPSLTGDVYSTPWVWSRVPVAHWDAGDPGGHPVLIYDTNTFNDTPTPKRCINGPYSKFQYVPSLKALVHFATNPPQIITLPGMD